MVAESTLDTTIMPLATCYSASIHGIHAQKVDVEVHIGTGTPSMVIVGFRMWPFENPAIESVPLSRRAVLPCPKDT